MAPYGGQDKYYSASPGETKPIQKVDDSRWLESILASDAYYDAVYRVFKQWNNTLRDQLRTETGLRLSVGEDVQAVPVRIVDGLPRPLSQIISHFSPDDLRLLMNRSLFASLDSDLPSLAQDYDHISRWLGQSPPEASCDEVVRVQRFVHDITENLKTFDLEKRMRSIDQDVLGAYFYNMPEIRLYWVAIAVTARFLGLPVEALAFVVLTHELAHAYTHLGRDIDGRRWETYSLARTDIPIVEGLAQHYTEVICSHLTSKFPLGTQAYKALLELQHSTYRVHQKWPRKRAGGEIVRLAMIATRCSGNEDYRAFEEQLAQSHLAVGASEL